MNEDLAVHWSGFGMGSVLYDELLSIPLFTEYTENEVRSLGEKVLEYIKDQTR